MEDYDNLIKTRDIIKRKFNELRRGHVEVATHLEKQFKPIVNPLKELVELQKEQYEKKDTPTADSLKIVDQKEDKFHPEEDEIKLPNNENASISDENVNSLVYNKLSDHDDSPSVETENTSNIHSYFLGISRKNRTFDFIYGLRKADTGKLMIGNQSVSIGETNELAVKNKKFFLTLGLIELLCKKNPQDYTTDDLENYKRILELTNAHKIQYDSSEKVYRNKSQKYNLIISKLFPPLNEVKRKKGSGVFVPQAEKTYIYWDDPNELAERLFLLLAESKAGHTGHDREILSIEEELREAGHIK